MNRPVLVTGAAGFVGTHLLDVLCVRDSPVIGWRRPSVPHPNPSPLATWLDVELLDRSAVARALADARPSAVYHLAGAAHVAQSWANTRETYEANVLATHNLFEALRALEMKPRVLVTGSATIYRSQPRPLIEDDELLPGSPYATSKLAQEMLARRAWEEDQLPTIIARSFNHVGPGQDPSYVASSIARQIALIEAEQAPPILSMGNLEPRRDMTDVRDTVRAYVVMMDRARPGVVYNVSSGHAVTIGELAPTFIARARRPVSIVQDPARFRPNDQPLLVGDHTRLTTDTGWRPEIPFEETVDDLLEYWRAQIGRSRV
jgi:GDP-4-dehydro-6-deoxy-D-mannose reductase